MVFKDALILSFYLDKDDPEELSAFEDLKKGLDTKLRASNLGIYDGCSYDVKGQCFKIDILGNDAELMLNAVIPVIKNAHFLIGPKAILIMRGYEHKGMAVIKHVDL